jgi:hypothetical protein
LVGPVALYPDDLLAILLPGATTPLQIVKAQRFLEKRKSNQNLQPDPSLPEPVRNLLNYPDVVKKMSDDLDWTERLGDAVVGQQTDVMAAIQAFRRKVHAAGNLNTDDKQVIVVEKEVIKVVQADPQVIYVPQYQPAVVIVQQPAPVVTYYPTPYPVYYYPYPPGAAFATGFFFGAATAYAFSWHHHALYHHYDVEELQQERIDYAREAREDRQAHQKEMQSQRQERASERQTQRQEATGRPQSSPAQTQRRQATTQTQAQRTQPQMAAAGTAKAGGQTWRPQGQQGQLQTASAQRTRLGDSQFSRQGGGLGGAFGGGSSSFASGASQRGFQSRSALGGWSGGGRGGGGRRR